MFTRRIFSALAGACLILGLLGPATAVAAGESST